jgi:hypothetical protein
MAGVDHRARRLAACVFIEEVADRFRLTTETVWASLTHVTDDDLWMLDSPDGWAMLAAEVQTRLGVDVAPYRPSIH